MADIVDIIAREILDSRGNPTVEADVVLDSGAIGRAAVPSGASTGAHEAVELRDDDARALRRQGCTDGRRQHRGRDYSMRLAEMDPTEQVKIDEILIDLDGTANKSRLGANAVLAVSLAVAKAAAESNWDCRCIAMWAASMRARCRCHKMNIVNGGVHADNPIDIQEFMIYAGRRRHGRPTACVWVRRFLLP